MVAVGLVLDMGNLLCRIRVHGVVADTCSPSFILIL